MAQNIVICCGSTNRQFSSLGRPRNALRDAKQPFVLLHTSVPKRIGAGIGYAPSNPPHTDAEIRAAFKIET